MLPKKERGRKLKGTRRETEDLGIFWEGKRP